MNIAFFGSSHFAAASLEALIKGKHKIVCVVTQPDSKKGRGLHMASTAIKDIAAKQGLELYQPESINSADSESFLKQLGPDLFIVIAYGQILSKAVLEIPSLFTVNVHASLLPLYRGAAPVNWSIIRGEKKTGVSVLKMEEKMDAGPLILQKIAGITEDDTAISLEEKLSKLAAQSLSECLSLIESNSIEFIQQDENSVSFAPRLKKKDGLISWDKPAETIYNLVRGCYGWPGAFSFYKGKLLKVHRAKAYPLSFRAQPSVSAGEIIRIDKEGILVASKDSALLIEELQEEGKRRMIASEFIAGHRISVGEKFTGSRFKK
ncbi:MAG: methionyl-tRNA formyltransferase [Candidatus Omnitrophica bacterium]|nr:methionyl-tRNA formyltransferase [Candidatus Omnitrophota bacterium]